MSIAGDEHTESRDSARRFRLGLWLLGIVAGAGLVAVFTLSAIAIVSTTNARRTRHSGHYALKSAVVPVRVVDSAGRPIADATVRLESETEPSPRVTIGDTNDEGMTIVKGYYFAIHKKYWDGETKQCGPARLSVTAPGYVRTEVGIEVPIDEDLIVVKLETP